MFSTGQVVEGAVAYTATNAVCGEIATGVPLVDVANQGNMTLPANQACASPIGPKWVSSVTNWLCYVIDKAGLEFRPGNACQDPLLLYKAIQGLTTRMMVQKQRDVAVTAPPVLTTAVWKIWTINTTLVNEIVGASLSSTTGQITLPSGKYIARFGGAVQGGGRHQARLYNDTLGVTLGSGMTCDSYVGTAVDTSATTNVSVGETQFTLDTISVIELDHINWGSGAAMGDGTTVGGGLDYDCYVTIEKIG